MNKPASLLLRLGLAFVFLYASFGSFTHPGDWIGFIPPQLRAILPAEKLLLAHASFETGLGLWLISGQKLFYAGIVASLGLIAIILPNLGSMDIVFRDVGLLFSALALVFLSRSSQVD